MNFTMKKSIAVLAAPLILVGCASDKNTKSYESETRLTHEHREQPGEDYERTGVSKVETDVDEDSVEVQVQRTEVTERPGKVDYKTTSRVEVEADGDRLDTERTFDVELMERGPDEKIVRVDTLSIEPKTPRMVHFATDSAKLDKRDKRLLRDRAEWLRKHPEARVVIEGHTDERGSDEYNFELAEQRAENVLKYLATLGIEKDRLEVVAMGEVAPLSEGQNPKAYLMNRRVELERAAK